MRLLKHVLMQRLQLRSILDRLRKEVEEARKSLNHHNEGGTAWPGLPLPGGLISCLVAWPKPV